MIRLNFSAIVLLLLSSAYNVAAQDEARAKGEIGLGIKPFSPCKKNKKDKKDKKDKKTNAPVPGCIPDCEGEGCCVDGGGYYGGGYYGSYYGYYGGSCKKKSSGKGKGKGKGKKSYSYYGDLRPTSAPKALPVVPTAPTASPVVVPTPLPTAPTASPVVVPTPLPTAPTASPAFVPPPTAPSRRRRHLK